MCIFKDRPFFGGLVQFVLWSRLCQIFICIFFRGNEYFGNDLADYADDLTPLFVCLLIRCFIFTHCIYAKTTYNKKHGIYGIIDFEKKMLRHFS